MPKGVKRPAEEVARRKAAVRKAWELRNKEKISAAHADWFAKYGTAPTKEDLKREYRAVYWKKYIPKLKEKKALEYANPRGRAKILLRSAERRSAKRGHPPPEITLEDVERMLASGKCSVSGLNFVYAPSGTNHPRSPSLDRIDSSVGYTRNNTRAVCWAVNAGCANWGLDEYIAIAKSVIEQRRNSMDPQ